MRGLRTRSALAVVAIAAAVLGSAATAAAAPMGPCAKVTFVGVCEPLRDAPSTPAQHGMGEVVIPEANNGIPTVN